MQSPSLTSDTTAQAMMSAVTTAPACPERPAYSLEGGVVFLPAIIIAAINTFVEEFEFRSRPPARLEPVEGASQAILMTSGLFGLRHRFGTLGGVFGVPLSACLGWIAAKSMIETGGFVWAFSIHFVGEVVYHTTWVQLTGAKNPARKEPVCLP